LAQRLARLVFSSPATATHRDFPSAALLLLLVSQSIIGGQLVESLLAFRLVFSCICTEFRPFNVIANSEFVLWQNQRSSNSVMATEKDSEATAWR
jgi:hypothetical protein